MKTLLLALVLSAGLTGCFAHGGVVVETGIVNPQPTYVYTYADGSCWADDRWYAPCPWNMMGVPGYYGYWEGRWYHHNERVWGDRLVPPPRGWVGPPSPRHEHWNTPPTPRWHGQPPQTWRGQPPRNAPTPPSHGGHRHR